MDNKPTLTPRSITIRNHQHRKIRDAQKSEMDLKKVNREQDAYNSSVAASSDHYMKSALNKVRQSNITHSEDLTRINGTWLHNQNMKN